MSSTFKTPKGTILYLVDIKSKPYLPVQERLIWFREEKPNWSIVTEFESVTADSAFARAFLKDESGRLMATAHKFETKAGFADFIEKAETGAIGRALAFCGYGTQFTGLEIDEGSDRIVDSPSNRPGTVLDALDKHKNLVVDSKPNLKSPGEYVPTFGKYKGICLGNLDVNELIGYKDYLIGKAKADDKQIKGPVLEFIQHVEAYAKSVKAEADPIDVALQSKAPSDYVKQIRDTNWGEKQ